MRFFAGYVTSIDHKDGGLLVNVQISHKVLRTDTVYDMLRDISNNNSNNSGESIFDALRKQIVGETVLTKYNNRWVWDFAVHYRQTGGHTLLTNLD